MIESCLDLVSKQVAKKKKTPQLMWIAVIKYYWLPSPRIMLLRFICYFEYLLGTKYGANYWGVHRAGIFDGFLEGQSSWAVKWLWKE